MKFYTYEVHWLDGKVETIMGCDFVHALTRAGNDDARRDNRRKLKRIRRKQEWQ